MAGIIALGSQWGDEGKGKIVDFISKKVDMVVRYQGGNNAGHTISINNKKYALNLIPSGIFYKNVKNVLANGTVINPFALVNEITNLEKEGHVIDNLYISDRAHIILPYHLELDKLQEEAKGTQQIGTTKKGIGPAYTDKAAREGIRVADLFSDERLEMLLQSNLKIKNMIFKEFGKEPIEYKLLLEELKTIREKIRPFVKDTSLLINEYLDDNKKVLFEGAQGSLLCIEHGTYPFVTSSSPLASYVGLGAGVSLFKIKKVVGVVKSYTTRVGAGAFPTELNKDEETALLHIRKVGNEYGVVTKRPRRIGWLDIPLLKYSTRLNGFTSISLTLLDVLTNISKLKICTKYLLNGKEIKSPPALDEEYKKVTCEYVELDGWTEDISLITSFTDLPQNAKIYVKKVEELLGVKVSIVSVGKNRSQTIVIEDPI